MRPLFSVFVVFVSLIAIPASAENFETRLQDLQHKIQIQEQELKTLSHALDQQIAQGSGPKETVKLYKKAVETRDQYQAQLQQLLKEEGRAISSSQDIE